MKKYVLVIIIVHITFISIAQILKIDKDKLLLDSSRMLIGNVAMNFDVHNKSATSEKEIRFVGLKGTTDLVYLSHKHAYISISNIHYSKSTGGPLSSNGYSHFRINFLRTRKLSYETFTQAQYDNGRNMPFRFLIGGGVRLRLYESDKISLHTGIGMLHETEHWRDISGDNSIIEKQIIKTSNYLGMNTQLNSYVQLAMALYYQGGFDKESDLFRSRMSTDLLFKVKVTNKISFITSFSIQYEDKPIIPINNYVYSLNNGIIWDF